MTISTPLQQRINLYLQHHLPDIHTIPSRLHQAMHYTVFSGGKRIRPLLVYATGLCFQVDLAKLDVPAAAIELMHSYSLIHDDLPAMDDDDHRRGKLSCHKAFDEATAILAGDALQTLAFHLLSKPHDLLTHAQQLSMINVLAHTAGSLGMAGGQQLDLDNKNKKLSTAEVDHIYQLKTSTLFQASIRLGLLAAHCDDNNQIKYFDQFATLLGVAFQSQDDHLDQDVPIRCTENKVDRLFAEAQTTLAHLTIDCTPLLAILPILRTHVTIQVVDNYKVGS